MGHGDEHMLHARGGGVGDDLVEHRDHQVEPLDREARLAGESAMQEALEHFDLRDAVEQLAALDVIDRRPVAPRLHRLTQPHALVGHEDLREVVAARGAVDGAEPLDGLEGVRRPGRHRPADDAGRQRAQHVAREAVRVRMQRRVTDRTMVADGIERGGKMTVAADRLGERHGRDGGRGVGGAGGGQGR